MISMKRKAVEARKAKAKSIREGRENFSVEMGSIGMDASNCIFHQDGSQPDAWVQYLAVQPSGSPEAGNCQVGTIDVDGNPDFSKQKDFNPGQEEDAIKYFNSLTREKVPLEMVKQVFGKTESKVNNMKTRKLAVNEAKMLIRLRKENKGRKLEFYGDEDLPGEGSSDVFVAVDKPASADPEIKVAGDDVFVGPFDSTDSAHDAAGADVEVVDASGSPLDADAAAPGAGAPGAEDDLGDVGYPMEGRTRKARLEAFRKTFRKKVQETADGLDVQTSVGNGKEMTDNNAGNLDQSGVGGNVNQTPGDAGTQTSLDTPTDTDPNLNGMTESVLGLSRGNTVVVREKNSLKKVDSGRVTKVEQRTVHVEGTEYDASKYTFIRTS